jgi:hypothetical protein
LQISFDLPAVASAIIQFCLHNTTQGNLPGMKAAEVLDEAFMTVVQQTNTNIGIE